MVTFKPPRNVPNGQRRKGKIIDEAWADNRRFDDRHNEGHVPNCWGDYAFCAQLIEWESGMRSIRLAYYRRSCGSERWLFASQTTVESNPDDIKALCERTLSRSEWFNKATTPSISH